MLTKKDWLDLAWKYFQQHAQQRTQYFNYFIIFSSILTTALFTSIQKEIYPNLIGIGIGLFQSFMAFMFWKIDERNKFLIKHAEEAIKGMEDSYSVDDINFFKLFSEEQKRSTLQMKNGSTIFHRQISHSEFFKIIFFAFFCIGIIGSICAISTHFCR